MIVAGFGLTEKRQKEALFRPYCKENVEKRVFAFIAMTHERHKASAPEQMSGAPFFSFSPPKGEKVGMRGPMARSVSNIHFEKRYNAEESFWRS